MLRAEPFAIYSRAERLAVLREARALFGASFALAVRADFEARNLRALPHVLRAAVAGAVLQGFAALGATMRADVERFEAHAAGPLTRPEARALAVQ